MSQLVSTRIRLTLLLLVALIALSACNHESGGLTSPPKPLIEARTAPKEVVVNWENPDNLFGAVLEIKDKADSLVDLLAFPPEVNSYNFTAEEGGHYNFTLLFILNDKTVIESQTERGFLLKSDLPIIYIDTPNGFP